MSEVGGLISEAVQNMLDKLHHSDEKNRELKNTVRTLDNKLRTVEGTVNRLLQLQKLVEGLNKKQSSTQADFD